MTQELIAAMRTCGNTIFLHSALSVIFPENSSNLFFCYSNLLQTRTIESIPPDSAVIHADTFPDYLSYGDRPCSPIYSNFLPTQFLSWRLAFDIGELFRLFLAENGQFLNQQFRRPQRQLLLHQFYHSVLILPCWQPDVFCVMR